jgi:hypothetical protein
MQAVFENRRSGGERRSGERRRLPADSARIPDGQNRRSGTDRRRATRRIADGADLIPERYDYQWRNRWP